MVIGPGKTQVIYWENPLTGYNIIFCKLASASILKIKVAISLPPSCVKKP
jgi:hypothetical protein